MLEYEWGRVTAAAHAHHYLAVFDEHANEALPGAQQAVRVGRAADRAACARSRVHQAGMHGAGYGAQVHHVNGWARDNGQTTIDEEVFACGADNRLAEHYIHHPERLLVEPGP